MTNIRSPYSSKTRAASPASRASTSSAVSSAILSRTAPASGQSKPTRAARFCSLTARVSAGRPVATPASVPALAALAGLGPLPVGGLLVGGLVPAVVAEDVRVAADHLVGDGAHHVVPGEGAGLLGHARVIDHLEEEVAELVAELGHVAARDGLGHLVGLLDGVGRDAVEVLLDVPGTAAPGRAAAP